MEWTDMHVLRHQLIQKKSELITSETKHSIKTVSLDLTEFL